MAVDGTASLELFSSADGGPKGAFPSGTRSLLISFDDSIEGDPFGAVIDVLDGGDLEPSKYVRLSFWADTARIYGSEGAAFAVLYGLDASRHKMRAVGRGRIVEGVE